MSIDAPQIGSGFNRLLGIELVEWTADGVVGRLRLRPDLLNSNEIVHGGIYLTLLDFGCGIAGCHAPDGAPRKRCVTLSLTTNFLAPAREGELTVRARRTGGGRTVFFAEAEVTDAAGNLLAKGTGAFRYIASQDRPGTNEPPAGRAPTEDTQ